MFMEPLSTSIELPPNAFTPAVLMLLMLKLPIDPKN